MLGFLGVLPGSGGIYRYRSLGSLEEGPIKSYFDILLPSCSNDEGIVVGNIRLAEDRVLPMLVTFQTNSECIKRSLDRPRLSFIPDAVSYCEAEYPLEALVKQRRRWNNGASFKQVWLFTHRKCA